LYQQQNHIEDMYLYAHADNGEYVVQKHGKPLYDEEDRPNFHDNFIEEVSLAFSEMVLEDFSLSTFP
jgi:hypothetical protein